MYRHQTLFCRFRVMLKNICIKLIKMKKNVKMSNCTKFLRTNLLEYYFYKYKIFNINN